MRHWHIEHRAKAMGAGQGVEDCKTFRVLRVLTWADEKI